LSRPGPAWKDELAAASSSSAAGLEEGIQRAVARCGAGDVGDLRRVPGRDADVQPHRQRGDADGERGYDQQCQSQRRPSEPAAVSGAELAELADRGGRGFGPAASAIATGKDSNTAIGAAPCGPVTGARPCAIDGWANPCTIITAALAMKSSVITANVSLPP
jgi:hypothetical protein